MSFAVLEDIPVSRVPHLWNWINDRCGSGKGLLLRLIDGSAVAMKIKGTDAAVILSAGRTKDTNVPALWIEMLGGKVGSRPKQNLQLMASALTDIRLICAQLGCVEMRAELKLARPDWRKRILPLMGFEPVEIDGAIVMRKAT